MTGRSDAERDASVENPEWLRKLADALACWEPVGIDYRRALYGAADALDAALARVQQAEAEAAAYRERYGNQMSAGQEICDENDRLRAELANFKPQPMSQRCRDGHHNSVGDWRCHNCRCLCHNLDAELAEARAERDELRGKLADAGTQLGWSELAAGLDAGKLGALRAERDALAVKVQAVEAAWRVAKSELFAATQTAIDDRRDIVRALIYAARDRMNAALAAVSSEPEDGGQQ